MECACYFDFCRLCLVIVIRLESIRVFPCVELFVIVDDLWTFHVQGRNLGAVVGCRQHSAKRSISGIVNHASMLEFGVP